MNDGLTLEREALVLERAVACYGPEGVTAMALDALGGLTQGLSGYLRWKTAGDSDPDQAMEQIREDMAAVSVALGLLELAFGPIAEEEEYRLHRLEKKVGWIEAVTSGKEPIPAEESPAEKAEDGEAALRRKNVDLLCWMMKEETMALAREKTGAEFFGLVLKALQGKTDEDEDEDEEKPHRGKPISFGSQSKPKRGRRKKEAEHE